MQDRGKTVNTTENTSKIIITNGKRLIKKDIGKRLVNTIKKDTKGGGNKMTNYLELRAKECMYCHKEFEGFKDTLFCSESCRQNYLREKYGI